MRRSRRLNIVPAEEIARRSHRVSLEERLADLREAPGVTARIRRLGTGGNDLKDGVYPVRCIDPGNLHSMIYEDHGGGTYEMRFHIDRKPLLMTNGRLETYTFTLAGEPKTTKREGERSAGETIIEKLPDLIGAFDPSALATLRDILGRLVGSATFAFTELVRRAGPEATSELFAELSEIYEENGWDIGKMHNALSNFLVEQRLLQPDETAQEEETPSGGER